MSIVVTPVVTAAGAQPTPPATLNANLIAEAELIQPGVTANLPGTLVEDLASVAVGALMVTDSAFADAINSVAATYASTFILTQLGQQYGVPQGIGFNASVNEVFTGPAGFAINAGFTVTDGTNQYVVQDGGVIETGGSSAPLFCVAVQAGTFAIPANSVNQLVTSVPTGYTVTCNNPQPGIPASAAQTTADYQAAVLQAGQATAQGMPSTLKKLLALVPGVVPRLISVKQNGAFWIVSAAGGDPYAMAYAIYLGVSDPAILAGSSIGVTAITNANPGVVTTDTAHGLTDGQTGVQINGAAGISGINGVNMTVHVLTPYTFATGIDTASSGAWTGGGVVTPNVRNQLVAINDAPDTYQIPFSEPLQEATGIVATWNTNSLNFINPAAVSALAIPAIVAYVNSVPTGEPINLLLLQNAFQAAVASILPANLISRLVFSVTVNGVSVAPDAGTDIVRGDAFSYFQTSTGLVTVLKG